MKEEKIWIVIKYMMLLMVILALILLVMNLSNNYNKSQIHAKCFISYGEDFCKEKGLILGGRTLDFKSFYCINNESLDIRNNIEEKFNYLQSEIDKCNIESGWE